MNTFQDVFLDSWTNTKYKICKCTRMQHPFWPIFNWIQTQDISGSSWDCWGFCISIHSVWIWTLRHVTIKLVQGQQKLCNSQPRDSLETGDSVMIWYEGGVLERLSRSQTDGTRRTFNGSYGQKLNIIRTSMFSVVYINLKIEIILFS